MENNKVQKIFSYNGIDYIDDIDDQDTNHDINYDDLDVLDYLDYINDSDDNSKKGIIYRITNKLNGTEYYGLSTKTLEERKRIHIQAAKSAANGKTAFCRRLYNAMNYYGYDMFDFELMETPLLSQLGEREKYYIKTYNSLVPNGYNLTTGGELTILSQESRDLKSASLRKHELSKGLPTYASIVDTDKNKEILIMRHPLCKTNVTFTVKKYGSFEAAKEACLKFLEELKTSGKIYEPTNRINGLPRGINIIPNGYQINKRSDGKRYRRNFADPDESDDVKLQKAINCLNELLKKFPNKRINVQRLNASPIHYT